MASSEPAPSLVRPAIEAIRSPLPSRDRADAAATPTHARVIQLPRVTDPRGNLTFIEEGDHVPFDIRRVYYLYDVPGGETRGGHAHRRLEQLIIAASGSFTVVLDDGFHRQSVYLNRAYYGLYVPRMVWREIEDFSSASICLVLASDHYREEDYFRDYTEFVSAARCAA